MGLGDGLVPGMAPDPSDPFGEQQTLFSGEPAIAPIRPISNTFNQTSTQVGGGGGTVVNLPGEQSSVTQKIRSPETRAAEAQAAQSAAQLDATRSALAEVSGDVQMQAQELTRVAREEEIKANNAAAQGYGDAEAEHAKKLAEVSALSKAAHDQALKDIQEQGKHPFADKSLVFKIGLALLSGSNSYNNYVMGLDPTKSPFATNLRGMIDREEAKQVATIKANAQYAQILREQGKEAADSWLNNRRSTIKDQLAASISAAQAKVSGAASMAEQNMVVQIPIIGPDGKPTVGPDGKPALEMVPYAVAKERVAAQEKQRLGQESVLGRLAEHEATSKMVEKNATGTPGEGQGPVSTDGKPLTSNSIVGLTGEYVGEAPTGKLGQTSELAQKVQTGFGTLDRLRDWRGRMGQFIAKNGHTLNKYKPETSNEFNSLITEGGGILTQSNQTGVLNNSEFDRYSKQIGGNSMWATPKGVQDGLDAIIRAGEANQSGNIRAVFPTYNPSAAPKSEADRYTVEDLQRLKAALESGTHSIKDPKAKARALARIDAQLAAKGVK